MKRLLGLLGLVCLGVLTACFYLGDIASVVIAVAGVLLFAASMCIPKSRVGGTLPLAGITMLLCATFFLVYTYTSVVPIQTQFDEKTVRVTAVQVGESYHNYNNYCYELKVNTIDGKEVGTKIMLYSPDAIITEPYDEFDFKATLYATDSSSLLSRRIRFTAYVQSSSDVTHTSPESRPFMYYVCALRSQLRRALYLELDADTAAFSSALLLGDKYSMDVDEKELLRTCGISHIAVVSGLHLSVISNICKKALMFVTRKNKYLSNIITILFIFSFAVLTGLGRSVIRAAVMLSIFLMGEMINRRSDSVNSIGAAALVLCIPNPYVVGDVGVLLSFTATLGIVLWAQRINNYIMTKLERFKLFTLKFIGFVTKTLVFCFSTTLCAAIWTLPVCVIFFGGFSLVGIIVNVLTVPVMSVVLVLIALCIITHYLSFIPVLCDIISLFITLYHRYLISVCKFFSELPFAFVSVNKPYFYVFMGLTFLLIIVSLIVRRKFMYQLTVLLSFVILFTSLTIHLYAFDKRAYLHIPDTGNGLTVILETSEGHAVLCASGTSKGIYPLETTLNSMPSTKEDVMIITPAANSQRYTKEILSAFDYKHILRYDSNIDGQAQNDTVYGTETLFSGDYELELWDKAQVRLIEADKYVFEYITISDMDILIVPTKGDCELLPEEYRSPDAVIVRDIPKSYELLNFDTVIVAGSDSKTFKTLSTFSDMSYHTIYGENICYEIKLN